MMAIFGWFVYILIMFYVSAVICIVSTNLLGTYNIGGVPNKVSDKLLAVFLILILFCGWYGVVEFAPFTLIVK